MLKGTIVERDGKLYVRHAYCDYWEPYEHVMFWLILSTKGNPYSADRPSVGDEAVYQSGWSDWHTSNSQRTSTGSVCTGDGSAQAVFRERNPVPKPAARGKELRWHDGRWEKLLKKGWVPA